MKIKKSDLNKDQRVLDQFVKVQEAAKILDCCRNTVYTRMREGKLLVATICEGTGAADVLFYRKQVEALANE